MSGLHVPLGCLARLAPNGHQDAGSRAAHGPGRCLPRSVTNAHCDKATRPVAPWSACRSASLLAEFGCKEQPAVGDSGRPRVLLVRESSTDVVGSSVAGTAQKQPTDRAWVAQLLCDWGAAVGLLPRKRRLSAPRSRCAQPRKHDRRTVSPSPQWGGKRGGELRNAASACTSSARPALRAEGSASVTSWVRDAAAVFATDSPMSAAAVAIAPTASATRTDRRSTSQTRLNSSDISEPKSQHLGLLSAKTNLRLEGGRKPQLNYIRHSPTAHWAGYRAWCPGAKAR